MQRIYTDPHSPDIFRIKVYLTPNIRQDSGANDMQGTTANSREFREAFSCPVKEPTCELW